MHVPSVNKSTNVQNARRWITLRIRIVLYNKRLYADDHSPSSEEVGSK